MTYNPEDWQAGDLAWITVPGSRRGEDRTLRILCHRRGEYSGALHWWGPDGFLDLHSSQITNAERAIAVTPDMANRLSATG